MVLAVFAAGCAGSEEPAAQTPPAPTEEPADGPYVPEFVDGVLQPTPGGFPSQPVTIMVVDEAGSDDGIYARQVQAIARGLSPVDVTVVDRPDLGGYGTWEALSVIKGQSGGPEGHIMVVTTIPGATSDLLSTPVAEEFGVTIESLNFVLVTESVPWLILGRADAPWGDSIEELVAFAKANPGTVKYISRGPGAGLNLAFQEYMQVLGFDVETIIGGSLEEINIAIGAGAGDIAVNVAGVSLPFIEDGRVKLLSCTGPIDPCGGPFQNPPRNMQSLTGAALDPWGSNRGLVVPDTTPAENKLWLEALIREVISQQEFIDQRQRIPGLTLVAFQQEEAIALQKTAYDIGLRVLGAAGLLDPTVVD
jgi:tripartite-type tricarboxylate transporter receptor subunit TctC